MCGVLVGFGCKPDRRSATLNACRSLATPSSLPALQDESVVVGLAVVDEAACTVKDDGQRPADHAGGRRFGGINVLLRNREGVAGDSMQGHVQMVRAQARARQAMLCAQRCPNQREALGVLRLRKDRQEQVVAQQLPRAAVEDLRLKQCWRCVQSPQAHLVVHGIQW